ncbi:hypothetical protein POBR111598_09945 [Polynucleobacter brandtiae]
MPAKLPAKLISLAVREVFPKAVAVLPKLIVDVPAFRVRVLLAPATAPSRFKAAFAAAVEILVLSARVMPVLASPTLNVPPLVKLPARVTALGAVAVTPPLNVKVSAAASPSIKVPVLAKVTALVIVFAEPINRTL